MGNIGIGLKYLSTISYSLESFNHPVLIIHFFLLEGYYLLGFRKFLAPFFGRV